MDNLREQVHILVDNLPETELEAVLELLQRRGSPNRPSSSWWAKADAFYEAQKTKYGVQASTVELIREMREERLNDIMGDR